MSFNFKELPNKIRPLLQSIRRYKKFIFFVALLSVYGWLVFSINSLSSVEPTDEAISQKLQTSPRPKIDATALEKVQQLQDNSVEVQTLFKQARDNPFQE